jgi:hypothetical protein
MSEIRLRAIAQIGKISRELEKAKANQYMPLPTAGKKHQLKAAGISTTTANRYEQLAAPEEQLAPAVESAMENYFATTSAISQIAKITRELEKTHGERTELLL